MVTDCFDFFREIDSSIVLCFLLWGCWQQFEQLIVEQKCPRNRKNSSAMKKCVHRYVVL